MWRRDARFSQLIERAKALAMKFGHEVRVVEWSANAELWECRLCRLDYVVDRRAERPYSGAAIDEPCMAQ